jgi:hypothetical protein
MEAAIAAALRGGKATRDVGGSLGTREAGAAIAGFIS